MCGIVGIVGRTSVNQALYDALTVLQHRGQDAAGIVTCDDKFHQRKDNGLVPDVFHTRHMLPLRGGAGTGHVRYPTAGCSASADAHPSYVNPPDGSHPSHTGPGAGREHVARSRDVRALVIRPAHGAERE